MGEVYPYRRRRRPVAIAAEAPIPVSELRLEDYTARLVDDLGVSTAIQLADIPAATLLKNRFRAARIAELRREILRVGLVPRADWLTTIEGRRRAPVGQ